MNIGIDLGTTFSVIAVNGLVTLKTKYGKGHYIKECNVTIIPSPYDELSIPSVTIEDPENPGKLLFGTDALSVTDEEHAPIMFSKRKIGSDEILTTGSIQMTAKGFAAAFLSYLKECAEKALGETVESAVITHPAYFDRIAVEQTREAAVEAGFKMELIDQMLMEPVAAALAYTRTDKRDPLNILTYDLGGGTFDVTVLQRKFGIIEMKAFDGDHLLGGYNFDRELVNWVRKQLEKRGRVFDLDLNTDIGKAAVVNLLRSAEKLKIELANCDDLNKMIEFRARNAIKDIEGKDVSINERISRKEFQEMIQPYLAKATENCKSALKKARLAPEDIHEVLLVGGSSYGPWVSESIKKLFPDITVKLFKPDLCVGIGAAIHGSIILPERITYNEIVIHLDAPQKSSIDIIYVKGEVSSMTSGNINAASVILKNSNGNKVGSCSLSADNKFNFQNIELMQLDSVNNYIIEVLDLNEKPVLTHEFSVLHEITSSDSSTVTTVLPRPLFIETFEGLIPLVQEGAALPARISKSFQRLNNNPNFDLSLYQNEEVIGVIRIENIPPEGGKGAFVDLELDVTPKNEIRGKAVIRTQNGSFKTEQAVSIRYNIVQVPELDKLKSEIIKIKNTAASDINNISSGFKNAVTAENIVLIDKLIIEAEKLMEQIPVERQEIYEIIKKIRVLLDPPKDDMHPSKKEFLDTLNYCKKTCTDLIQSAGNVSGEENSGISLDKSMVDSANDSIQKAEDFLKKLESIEKSGNEAAITKNRRNWLINFDKLNRIMSDISKDKTLLTPPTIYNILYAKRDVLAMLRQLFDASSKIEKSGKINDWIDELKNIYEVLIETLLELNSVDGNLSAEQGMAELRKIYTKQIRNNDVQNRIVLIGSVLTKVN